VRFAAWTEACVEESKEHFNTRRIEETHDMKNMKEVKAKLTQIGRGYCCAFFCCSACYTDAVPGHMSTSMETEREGVREK
jgi:hypothetical protein